MKKQKIFISFFFLCSCSLFEPENELPFKWVSNGNEFIFDYYSISDTVKNALNMRVIKINPDTDDGTLKIDWYYPQWDVIYAYQLVSADYTVFRRMDGIYSSAPTNCNAIFGIITDTFKYLIIPKKPVLDKEYFTYFCRNEINRTHTVIAIDTIVNVPYGKINTFIMQEEIDDTTKIRRFWNEETGLIKIEKGNFNTNQIITYVLVQ